MNSIIFSRFYYNKFLMTQQLYTKSIFAEDIYENGKKIREMTGAAAVDSVGDINKMVDTIGE